MKVFACLSMLIKVGDVVLIILYMKLNGTINKLLYYLYDTYSIVILELISCNSCFAIYILYLTYTLLLCKYLKTLCKLYWLLCYSAII